MNNGNGYRYSHITGPTDELAVFVPARRYTIHKPGPTFRPRPEPAICDEMPRPTGARQWRVYTRTGKALGVVWGTTDCEAVSRAIEALEVDQGVARGHYSPGMLRVEPVGTGIVSGQIITGGRP